MTKVEDIMSTNVFSCQLDDKLNKAAQIMWEHDCGSVPVVDGQSRVVGIITDRDVCMGAYTQGRNLSDIPVSSACSRAVQTCCRWESLARAEELMMRAQVRRLPIVDDHGVLAGMLSLSDLAHHLELVKHGAEGSVKPRDLAGVLESVSRPRQPQSLALEPLSAHECTASRCRAPFQALRRTRRIISQTRPAHNRARSRDCVHAATSPSEHDGHR